MVLGIKVLYCNAMFYIVSLQRVYKSSLLWSEFKIGVVPSCFVDKRLTILKIRGF